MKNTNVRAILGFTVVTLLTFGLLHSLRGQSPPPNTKCCDAISECSGCVLVGTGYRNIGINALGGCFATAPPNPNKHCEKDPNYICFRENGFGPFVTYPTKQDCINQTNPGNMIQGPFEIKMASCVIGRLGTTKCN